MEQKQNFFFHEGKSITELTGTKKRVDTEKEHAVQVPWIIPLEGRPWNSRS